MEESPVQKPTDASSASEADHLKVRILGLQFDPHRLIYSTIILMTALAIFDEGTERLNTDTVLIMMGVLFAPLFALSMAHAFSDALDLQIRMGRRLTRRDRWHVLGTNLEYMYVAVPPAVLTLILGPTELPGNVIVDIVLVMGLVSLFFWGSYAARKARLGVWVQLRLGFNYAVMGLIVVLVELALTHH